MKIGVDGKPEDLIPEKEQMSEETQTKKEKLSFKEKLNNFWYFHKWQTIIAVILIIGIAFSIFQLVGNTDPDAYIMYIGPSALTVKSKEVMADIAEDCLEDYNDDGERYLSILDITAAVGDDVPYTAYETNTDAVKRFNTEVTAGDSIIYLVEESFYEKLKDFGVLAKLSDIIDESLIPDNTYDEYGIRIENLDFFNQDGYSSIPGDTILCIRQSPDEDVISYGRTVDYWKSNEVLFKRMFSYISTEEGGETSEESETVPEIYDVSDYDAAIMYIGYGRIFETTGTALSASAEKYVLDRDNSGTKDIGVDYRVLEQSVTGSAYENNADDAEYFENQIEYGSDAIFLVEESFYEKLFASGLLVPLEETFSYTDSEGNKQVLLPEITSEDGFGVKVSELAFFNDFDSFNAFDKSLVLCIRKCPENADSGYYNSCVEFYKQMLSYKTVSGSESDK